MKPLPAAVLALVLASACHRDSGQLTRKDQSSYDVVQEGAASGGTSTIGGPGETLPSSTPPMTNTSLDTTTNFALNPTAVNGAPQGSIASTIPASASSGGTMPAAPAEPAAPGRPGTTPVQVARPVTGSQAPVITNVPATPIRTTRTAPARPSPSQTSAVPEPQPQPSTDTTATTTAPPATTTTNPPAHPDKPKDQPAPPPKTDTQQPPPQQPDDNPPPTQTDTRGAGRN